MLAFKIIVAPAPEELVLLEIVICVWLDDTIVTKLLPEVIDHVTG